LEAKIDALKESSSAPKSSLANIVAEKKDEEVVSNSLEVKDEDVPQESSLAGLGAELEHQESIREVKVVKVEGDNMAQKIKDGSKIEEKIKELMAKYKDGLSYEPKAKDKAGPDMQECPQECGLCVKPEDMEYHCYV